MGRPQPRSHNTGRSDSEKAAEFAGYVEEYGMDAVANRLLCEWYVDTDHPGWARLWNAVVASAAEDDLQAAA